VLDEALPAEPMEHFGHVGLHPRALPSREDDYVDVSGGHLCY